MLKPNNPQPPRVLLHILEYLPIFSGHAIFLHRLTPKLKQKGVDVRVLAGDFGELPRTEVLDGLQIDRFPFDPNQRHPFLSASLSAAAFLLRNRRSIDILHLNGFLDIYGIVTRTARLLRKGVVLQLVLLGSDDPETVATDYRFPKLRISTYAKADRILCISPQLVDSCLRCGINREKIAYVPQGVETDRFHPPDAEERRALRRQIGVDEEAPLATFVGAIIPRKGVDLLIEAWATIQKQFPTATLLLVGPHQFNEQDVNAAELTDFVARLRAAVAAQQLQVRFLGRQARVEDFLKAADLFILPSRKEGFGNVILEAMACGIPPVVTYMDGVAEASVRDGQTGLIVKDPNQLADAVLSLFQNPSRRLGLGAAARRAVEESFAIDLTAQRYVDLYQAVRRN